MKTLLVRTVDEWRDWLAEPHASESEVWLIFHKRHTGLASVAYKDALDDVLCVGWVDSLVRRLDDRPYALKFTSVGGPDDMRSGWPNAGITSTWWIPCHCTSRRHARPRRVVREGALASADVGDARTLRFPDESADAVLMLGPLYHLTDRADRVRALAEARCVCRRGGVVIAAAISRFASTLDGLRGGYLLDSAFASIADRDVRDGRHRNPTGDPRYFTTAYFHRPEEMAAECVGAGLNVAP
jgi:Methyltransferase domain